MKPNPGHCPDEARGKRVFVTLRNGRDNRNPPFATAVPGWPADGQGACNWTLSDGPADIIEWELVK